MTKDRKQEIREIVENWYQAGTGQKIADASRDVLAQALYASEEARLKPLRDVYEKWEKNSIAERQTIYQEQFMCDMWQAIKQTLGVSDDA